MYRKLTVLILITCLSPLLHAQPSPTESLEPTDYLTKEFHAGRREAFRAALPANSVAIVLAFPTRTFSNDVEYLYHANPDLYYFTGYREPNSLLLIFKEPQKDSAGNVYNEILYVQKRDARSEQWTGKRLGTEGARSKLGFTSAFNGEDLKNLTINFSKFEKVVMDRLPADLADSRDRADLYDLVQVIREKANMPQDISKDQRFDTKLYRKITAELREIKTPEEKDLLRKAVEISCQGQNEVMKAIRPDMSELEIQGLHEYVHKKYGAEGVGYGSIIGSGENGCTLHYETNTKTRIGKDMVLMDVGAEYHGYTADVTRTVPANGKFSEEAKQIYQLVYDAQEAAFKTLKDGAKWMEAESAARTIITEGLLRLGVAATKEEANRYYPHGLGHHIGMDVHDRGTYDKLKKDMVITIEPGIYIPSDSKCDKKWWGIAVRIEDDCLITQNGFELLSKYAPRKIEDIEKMIAEKSAIDNFNLPQLESRKKGF